MATTNSNQDHATRALSKLTSLVDNSFECSICLDTYSDPYVIPECLHRFCGACVKESIRKCGAECPTCRARITTRRGLRKDNKLQDMMSKVIRAVTHLNQANIECSMDSEKGTDSKTGTDTSSITKEDVNLSSVTGESACVPQRSKCVPKFLHDQAMATQETSVGARKDMDTGATERVTRKRKCEDASFEAGTDLPADASRTSKRSWNKISFEERCEQLLALKDEFGHCFVPTRYPLDPSLARWCQGMRCSHNQIQQGKATTYALSQERIERLEAIGFKWKIADFDKKFEQRCRALEAFKKKFGHCNVPQSYSVDPSLGKWCATIRFTYHQNKQGKPTKCNLSQDRIERLEEIGFKWKCKEKDKTFEQRCHDLEAFKRKFVHCNVPYRYSVDPSLWRWCTTMRAVYIQIQQGKPTKYNLSQDRIERLEEIGFKWKGKGHDMTIDAKL